MLDALPQDVLEVLRRTLEHAKDGLDKTQNNASYARCRMSKHQDEISIPSSSDEPASITRRDFLNTLRGLSTAGVAGSLVGGATLLAPQESTAAIDLFDKEPIAPESGVHRQEQVYKLRKDVALYYKNLPLVSKSSNGDDSRYANRIASYTKGLPHNTLGEVDALSYQVYADAIDRGDWELMKQIPMGNPNANRLTFRNIPSLWSIDYFGPDAQNVYLPPAPAFASAETAGEMVEMYWQALTRDVPLSKYDTDPLIAEACADLSNLSDFRGPKENGVVTPKTIFRAGFDGVLNGPFISQFLLTDIQYGPYVIKPQILTSPVGQDYLTNYAGWLQAQNGFVNMTKVNDPLKRYVRSGRDMGEFVGRDMLFQPYMDAAVVILRKFGSPYDAGNPYIGHPTNHGHGTLGPHHVFDLLARAARIAQTAAWYHKWVLHRRLRPEKFGGRVHNHMTNAASYPIHSDVLNSGAVSRVFSKQGNYLLAQQFPEGVPPHPSYPAGHAAIGGACATILKALFNENYEITNPLVASDDGLTVSSWGGGSLKLGHELNKLATNIAIGRDTAGVHWRSDSIEGMLMGEAIAIELLRDAREGYLEPFAGWSLTKFDGTTITI